MYSSTLHGSTKCQNVVRLADGITWYNSIIVGWFLLLEEHSENSKGWEMGNIQYELGL